MVTIIKTCHRNTCSFQGHHLVNIVHRNTEIPGNGWIAVSRNIPWDISHSLIALTTVRGTMAECRFLISNNVRKMFQFLELLFSNFLSGGKFLKLEFLESLLNAFLESSVNSFKSLSKIQSAIIDMSVVEEISLIKWRILMLGSWNYFRT